jgi:hypothetical protein
MAEQGFLGMTGTGRWSNEERPKSFREGILHLFPNGDAPLTAINSKGKSEKATDAEFKFYSKKLAEQSGTVAAVHKNEALSDAYGAGDSGTVGTVVYAKMAKIVADNFRVGHTATLVSTTDFTKRSFGKVVAVSKNGASSYIAVKLRVASAAGNLAAANFVDIVGNSNPEGSTIPDAISYESTKFFNYTQIFRTPLDITRTQRKTKMRTGDTYTELKREALQYHGIEMEQAALWGEKSEVTGDNGQPERTTQGIVSFVTEHVPTNVIEYTTGTSLSWKGGGEDWLDEKLSVLFRFGRSSKLALCGDRALLGIQRIVKASGQFEFVPTTGAYGIKVVRWVTPFGEIMLKRHPLFTFKSVRDSHILLMEPENMVFQFIDDTHFKKDDTQDKAGRIAYDGTKEEYLTEGGYEWRFPDGTLTTV